MDQIESNPFSRAATQTDGVRPLVAIVANSLPPYRLHFHRRIAREMPEIRLATLVTHETTNSPWALSAPPEINPVLFGRGESSDNQDRLGSAFREWRKGGELARWLQEQGASAVLVNGYNDPGRLRLIRWCRRHGVPSLLFGDSNIKGDFVSGWRAWVKRRGLPRVLGQLSGVLACGRLGRAYFERYGVAPGRIVYSPYEPDYDQIQSIPPDRIQAVARQFGLGEGRRRLVFSGRLVPVKRADLLLQAFARVASERPEWDLLMIGDGPLKQQLESSVPAELAGRVRWTGFLGDQATISALYRNCDVLVLPSDYEPWALVVNEAAAAGLAVVCSDVVGAAAELVVPGRNGAIFPPGSLQGLISGILHVTDPARVDTLKAGSGPVLEEWRRAADPVEGLREALRRLGVLPSADVRLTMTPGIAP